MSSCLVYSMIFISAYGWHCLGMDQASVKKIVLVLMELTCQCEGQILSKQRKVVLCGGCAMMKTPAGKRDRG